MEETTFVCSHCGAVRPISERYQICGEDVCESCVSNDTVLCDECGTRIWRNDAVHDDYTSFCVCCFEHAYTRCTECDCIVSNDTVHIYNNEPYCEDCWNQHETQKPIHAYNYKPYPIFYGDGPRYLGVELEIDGAGEDEYSAKHILGVANSDTEHLYIKRDGSLDDGLELVTYPMSLAYHEEQMPWDEILDEARSLGYISHKTMTCGLHVHISRDSFGETRLEQECSIARLLYFVEKFWTELLRFSRRTESQANRWAARYGMQLSPQEVLHTAKQPYAGRYMAVNLTNEETVEIRIFRGTLKLNTLIATLQMVNAICDVAVFMSDAEVQALSWHGFLERLYEPELIQYLKERNLYKNDPVTTEEET